MTASMPKTYNNPILSGFYPDPSICRVEDDYYMVTSSFVYYPGLPIFHSKDLVHWEQIGHGIHRVDQLDYKNCETSLGLWAPTIRHHKGTFYIINTFVSEGREARRDNYIITAKSPSGPWSDPIYIKGADGIDSSIFFEDDGRVYYAGNYICNDQAYEGHHGIYLQELDADSFQFIGDRKIIWNGLKTRSKWIEAPHIYKKDGYYYLMVAEGGTFEDHSVMIARCKTIDGDYDICPRNPIVSHRHMPLHSPISVVGHGDLIETQNGEWWMVLLGVRPFTDFHYNLGRETFLIPMTWDHNLWPRIDNHTGTVQSIDRCPDLPPTHVPYRSSTDHFDNDQLDYQWNTIHPPLKNFYSLKDNSGHLRLYTQPEVINEICTPAFVGRRQQHHYFSAKTKLDFHSVYNNEEAGLTLIQDDRFNISLLLSSRDGQPVLTLKKTCDGKVTHLAEETVSSCQYMALEGHGDHYQFYWSTKEHQMNALGPAIDASIMSSVINEGFTGAYIGMYSTSNGHDTAAYADYEWFTYIGHPSE